MSDEPKSPTDPRKCNDCHYVYGVLTKICPECNSEDTQFVDEATHKPTDGYGNPVDE